GVQEVDDVLKVNDDDAFVDEEQEGVRVVEGWVNVAARAQHLAANPADVDAEVRTFAEQDVVCVDGGGGCARTSVAGRGGVSVGDDGCVGTADALPAEWEGAREET